MTTASLHQQLPERAPEVGELVQVRSRRWLVEEVIESETQGQTPLVRLACADDDAQGQELDVYWEYELDRRILEEEGWNDLAAKGFDPPAHFSAFLHTLRWNCVTATDPNLFQSPFRAGIKIDAYQMEPLRKALRLPRVNLFIADDTGLGKTIEAGLIARELLLRKKAKTIVVSAPPSVLEQWQAELEERFGLVFEILDRAYLTRTRRERGFGVNPWRTHSRFLFSHSLLIDPTYADRPALEALGIAARMDLDDLTGSTAGGLHLATMGGLWQALAFGFAGVRPRGEALVVDPRLPPEWNALELSLRFRSRPLRLRIDRGGVSAGPAGWHVRDANDHWEVVPT